ncbi:MAG: T9SS type A sorting domain-containing protein [Ferruginibacter sp.]
MKTLQLRIVTLRYILRRVAAQKKYILGMCMCLYAALALTQEVNIYSGCNMVLSGNVYLVVNNTALKNNGTFTAGSGTVLFTGTTDTSIAYVSGNSTTNFYNLTLDKSVYGIALKSPVGVMNVLTLSAGQLYSNSTLTLLSDVSNTARLAAVPAGAGVNGTAMVERYIPALRAWRLMTAPVANAATIYNSWQNAGVYTAGRGLLVSAPGATTGMDNSNPSSLKKWNSSTQAFVSVTNTYTSMSGSSGNADNIGYFVFIRGDRNLSNFVAPNTNITTLTSIGTLQTGTQTFAAATPAGAYTLIGNPYASPIDFNSVTRGNLVKRFYTWDPALNVVGGYVVLDDINNDGIYIKSPSASAQTKEIQSSQAFYVETNINGAASMVIDESSKSATNNLAVFRPAGGAAGLSANEIIRANVLLHNANNISLFADGALAEFGPGYSDNVTNEDALKFTNINETLGFTRYGVLLAIERRPLINITDTLFLTLSRTSLRNYQLQVIPENFSRQDVSAFVEDSYLATTVPISLSDTNVVNFTIDNNAASAVTNRFRIVFKLLTVLPVTFTTVKAYQVNANIQVGWHVENEVNTLKYEVEKSANGSNFNLVNTTVSNAGGNYSWIDPTPFNGENFYRVKSTDRDGSIKYSSMVHVLLGNQATSFTVHPNPVKGNSIHLKFANQPKGLYHFNLINSTGQSIFNTQLSISNSNTSQTLTSSKTLPAGLYQLQITGPDNNVETQKIIIHQ